MSLGEDVASGDLTSRATVPVTARARATVVARQALVLAGAPLVGPLLEELAALGADAGAGAGAVTVVSTANDGARLSLGEAVCVLEGPARALLTLERTYLNFVGHLSGIATETSVFVDEVRATGASTRVLDTRKTTPGLRRLEKYAVACGGGSNHRMGLFDAVLIKDNHVAAAGGVGAAVRAALDLVEPGVEVECECDTLEQVEQALAAGAHALLLDNFTPAEVERAVALIAGRARVEVSGGVNLETVAAYARAGADDVSIGRLTHSAPSVDVSMELESLG